METLRPLVQAYLDELETVQWDTLESGSVEKTVEDIVMQCSVRINTLFVYMLRHGGFQQIQSDFDRRQLKEFVGDTFPLTCAEMRSVVEDIQCRRNLEVAKFVVKEITKKLSSELHTNVGSGAENKLLVSRRSAIKQKAIICMMVKGFQGILSHSLMDESPNMVAETPVMPLDKDELEEVSPDRIVIERIKRILDDLMEEIGVIETNENITEEEYDRLMPIILKEKDRTACEIVKLIRREAQSLWKRVENKTTVFFFQRFAKESVLRLVAKLRKELQLHLTEGNSSVVELLDRMDWLWKAMVPSQKDLDTSAADKRCLYKRIAKNIKAQFEVTSEELGALICQNLNPDKEFKGHFIDKIQSEVGTLMKEMLDWLYQQAELHGRERDITSLALEKIDRVLKNVPAFTEGLSVEECAMSAPIRDEAVQYAYKATGQPGPFMDKQCHFVVATLVKSILNAPTYIMNGDTIDTIIVELKTMLLAELGDSEFAFELSDRNTKSLIEAVKKDLSNRVGRSQWVLLILLSKEPEFLQYTAATLKTHLVTPLKKTGVAAFFTKAILSFLSV